MIRESNDNQLTLSEFDWPFLEPLDEDNRWVKLGNMIPWEALSEPYLKNFPNTMQGRPAKPARLVIGAVIIKHKLVLSDRETVDQISENPYLQYFVGLDGFQTSKPFDASLFVMIRRRMGQVVFDQFQQTIVDELDSHQQSHSQAISDKKDDGPGGGAPEATPENEQPQSETQQEPAPEEMEAKDTDSTTKVAEGKQGRLILDATVADQAIRYPTDLSLLNEAREFCEQIIDKLYAHTPLKKKPRTYRVKARREYLAVAKRRKAGVRVIRKAIKQQLQYVKRNLGHIEQLLTHFPQGQALPLPNWLLRRFWVIPHLFEQQLEMHRAKVHRCDNRIVSISQPWVRPIVRGKQHKPTEFGAKLNVSLDANGLARVDRHSWDAFHEGNDLPEQVQSYYDRFGYYPEVVMGDTIYGTRDNRAYLKALGIRFAGKPLGRPPKKSSVNAEQLKADKKRRQKEYRQRIPIEGKFGQGKSGYRLNYIRAKRSDTSISWVNAIFFVMNLLVLYERYFLGLILAMKQAAIARLGDCVLNRTLSRYLAQLESWAQPSAQFGVRVVLPA